MSIEDKNIPIPTDERIHSTQYNASVCYCECHINPNKLRCDACKEIHAKAINLWISSPIDRDLNNRLKALEERFKVKIHEDAILVGKIDCDLD